MQTGVLGNLGLNLKGAWDVDAVYKRNDVVAHEGSLYDAARAAVAGQEPGVSDAWILMLTGRSAEPELSGDLSLLDIKWSLAAILDPGFLDLSQDNGLLLRSAYPDAWAKISTSPNLLDDSAFQAQVTAQGSCGAFSRGDGSTTFRVPLLRKVYTRAADPASGLTAGMWQGDAIRNIKGRFDYLSGAQQTAGTSQGALYSDPAGFYKPDVGTNASGASFAFDASRYVPTADENRPVSVVMTPYIKMYGAVTDAGEANITQLIQQTNAKLDTSVYEAMQEESANLQIVGAAAYAYPAGLVSSKNVTSCTRASAGKYLVVSSTVKATSRFSQARAYYGTNAADFLTIRDIKDGSFTVQTDVTAGPADASFSVSWDNGGN